jgi:hypothetical protein
MDQFLQAVRNGNMDSMVSFFPKRGDWSYRRTIHRAQEARVGMWRIPGADTRRAIDGGPLGESFRTSYEGQAIGRFVHQVRHRHGRWQQLPGNRFIPPGGTRSSDIYVTWRLEDGEWVISSLADETFGRGPLPSWMAPARAG